mgnify:CR=1 FL=1
MSSAAPLPIFDDDAKRQVQYAGPNVALGKQPSRTSPPTDCLAPMTASRMGNYGFHWFGFDPIERDFRIGYKTYGGKLPHTSFSLCPIARALVMGYHSRQTEARG